ncbi:HesA/MoeB/ThiF family protein [Cytobacillus massiliigabonensis]|uniref:HesA/MoeB/ThiF family protein n=1 Tax=Cytobacillus massiliigabonensis TaxID=1871011 RepID=UPI000C826D68|nr:ThiF family adenylyltransferase [Cytobacillus massiliigabonensis]
MKYPLVRKHLIMVPFGQKLSIGTTPNTAIEIEDPDRLIYSVLSKCNGETTVEEIHNNIIEDFPSISIDDVKDIIKQVADMPYIMEDAELANHSNLNEYYRERHSRNINFLSNFDPKGTQKYEYMEKIINTTVILIGLGGVGSSILYNLASLGVKKVIGIDYDTVDLSNLNRQILYREKHIGMNKTDAASETIREFNSDVEFIPEYRKLSGYEDILNIIKTHNADFVICAADKPPLWIYRWTNQACLETNTPWIYGGNSETTSYFQTIIPFESACYQCKEKYIYANFPEAVEKYESILEGGYDAQNNCLTASSNVLGSFVIFDFIRTRTGIEKPLSINKLTYFDYKTYKIDSESVPIMETCSCHDMPLKGGETNENHYQSTK